jgi:exodeoxyribonuclease VII small subunit
MTRKKTDLSFEKTLLELEQIVEKMESGKLSLEDALTQFEKGVGLAKQCQTALSGAEQKVLKLIESRQGDLVLQPFDEEE